MTIDPPLIDGIDMTPVVDIGDHAFQMPIYPWEVELFPFYAVANQKRPCGWWRLWQYLLLGWRWRRNTRNA